MEDGRGESVQTPFARVVFAAPVCIRLFAIEQGSREPAIPAVQDVARLPGIQRHQEEGRNKFLIARSLLFLECGRKAWQSTVAA